LDRAASNIRERRTPSSNSLMLPFMPSNKRSLGARVVDAIEINDAGIDEAAQLEQMMASPVRCGRDEMRQSKAAAPISPAQRPATSFSKPGRATVPWRIGRDHRQ